MNVIFAYLIAGAVILAALIILIRGVTAFIRTRGASACEKCPYSGQCGAHGCVKRHKIP